MSDKQKKRAKDEVEAARERLKRFGKPASEVNHHDPERLARVVEGRENAPRIVSWAELGKRYRSL